MTEYEPNPPRINLRARTHLTDAILHNVSPECDAMQVDAIHDTALTATIAACRSRHGGPLVDFRDYLPRGAL